MNKYEITEEQLEEIVTLFESTVAVLYGLGLDKAVPGHVKHAMKLRSDLLQAAYDKYMLILEGKEDGE